MTTVQNTTLTGKEFTATEKSNSPTEDSLSCLPQEIQNTIFSYLSLRERVLCTTVNKYWRSSILNSPRTWYTLTDEPHGLYVLYQVLSKYEKYIQGTDVREIVLTGNNSAQVNQVPVTALNMERLMDFLKSLDCRYIEKAILLTQCYSTTWLEKFKAVAGNSLTYLVLDCFVHGQNSEIQVLTAFILDHFPNLHYLNLNVSKQAPPDRNGHVVSNQQLSKGGPHHSLRILILRIEFLSRDTTPFPTFSDHILSRLPKLRHISFDARCLSSEKTLKNLYRNLFTYCKELESLDNGWYPVYVSPWEKMPDSLQQKFFDDTSRSEGLKRFQIIPDSSADQVLLQLKSIIPECYKSLEEITIYDLDDAQLNYLTTFRFPHLKKFMCSAEISLGYLSVSLVPFLLENGRLLEHVELKYIEINDVLLDVLSTRTALQTLKLTYCREVTQKKLDGFRARSNAKVIEKRM